MVSTFYPPHIGGIEYHVENLSRELVKRGHQITVLTSALSNLPSNALSPEGIEVIRVKAYFPIGRIYPPVSNQGFILNVGSTISKILKEKNIDVMHAHGHHYYLTWRAISAAKKFGVPSILTLHGLDALRCCNLIAKIGEEIFNRTIFRRELKNITSLIGLTPHITDYAKKYGFLSKNCFSIPNGVNYAIYSSNIQKKIIYRQKYKIGLDKTVILFRGRFSQIKGVCELAEAAKQVVQKNQEAYFIFVGGGPLFSELTKALKPIRAQSKIFDWTPENIIHELYIASNIFVLPSKSEALPLTILEAMAAQLNIIATPVGGIPEILQNYPFKTIINNGSSSEISKAVLSTINENKRTAFDQQLINLGYMDEFDWEKIATNVERIYQEACCNYLELGVLPEKHFIFPDLDIKTNFRILKRK
jgi:glycosyltransferase involved in cell wall biosynthesis